MTTVLVVMTTVAMVTVSPVGAVLFSLLCLFVTFVCPAWLLRLQPLKKYDVSRYMWCIDMNFADNLKPEYIWAFYNMMPFVPDY